MFAGPLQRFPECLWPLALWERGRPEHWVENLARFGTREMFETSYEISVTLGS